MTTAELAVLHANLISEIAKANQQLVKGDRSVTKRSIGDLQKALATIDAETERVATTRTPTFGVVYAKDGL